MARTKLQPRKFIMKPRASPRTLSVPPRSTRTTSEPLEVFTSPDGVRGEVVRLGAPDDANTHVVFLPGNPGLIAMYRAHLARIAARLPHDVRANVALHGLGLPGHDMTGLNGVSTFGIDAHAAYTRAYTRIRVPPNSRVVLAAHSYGAHLALAVLKSLPTAVRERAALILLMPCVRDMAGCAGRMACTLLADPLHITSAAAWLAARLLPARARDALLARARYPQPVENAVRALLAAPRAALYRNVCALARDEMERIVDVPPSTPMLPPPRHDADDTGNVPGTRVHVLWVKDDKWCPPATVHALQDAFKPRIVVERADGVEHAFVLSHEQSEKVAGTVASWLVALVREEEKFEEP